MAWKLQGTESSGNWVLPEYGTIFIYFLGDVFFAMKRKYNEAFMEKKVVAILS